MAAASDVGPVQACARSRSEQELTETQQNRADEHSVMKAYQVVVFELIYISSCRKGLPPPPLDRLSVSSVSLCFKSSIGRVAPFPPLKTVPEFQFPCFLRLRNALTSSGPSQTKAPLECLGNQIKLIIK